jgi:hypothetical protein
MVPNENVDANLADNQPTACTKRKREETSGGETCKKIKVS